MTEQIYEAPCNTDWFQAELDSLALDSGEHLRVVWAPSQTVGRVVKAFEGESLGYLPEETRTRTYAKYPVRFGDFADYVRGQRYFRRVRINREWKFIEVGYQKSGEVIPGGVQLTDIAVPDIVHVNPSIHIFVIERKLPDDYAKPMHEEKRILGIIKTGVDLFGPFPAEGIWDFFDEISEHRQVSVSDTCCTVAAQHEVVCQGLYREPNSHDLERVKLSLARFKERQAKADWGPIKEQAARDLQKSMADYERETKKALYDELHECQRLDEIAQTRSRVVAGVNPPRHRTAY
jgi:hypothetical protein